MLTKRLTSATVATIVAITLVPLTAQSASAQTITSYCAENQFATPETRENPNNKELACQMQYLASRYDYTGPINGEMGVNSWKGIQRFLEERFNYDGPINGVPGTNTYKAMQRAGNALSPWNDVTVDGTFDRWSWRNWASAVRRTLTGD